MTNKITSASFWFEVFFSTLGCLITYVLILEYICCVGSITKGVVASISQADTFSVFGLRW